MEMNFFSKKYQINSLWIGFILLAFVNSFFMRDGSGFSGSIIPLTFGSIIWLIDQYRQSAWKSVNLNHKGINLFLLWIIGAILSSVLNMDVIIYAENSITTGLIQFFYKTIALVLYLIIAIFSYDIMCTLTDDVLVEKANKMLFYSFIIAGIYSAIEIIALIEESFKPILYILDALFRGGYEESTYFKVRSVSYEPSTLGNYLAIVAPFIYVKILDFNRKYLLAGIVLLIIAFMTYSRTVYVVIFFEFILLSLMKKTSKYIIFLTIVTMIIASVVKVVAGDLWFADIDIYTTVSSLLDSDESGRMNSNYMRYGSQVGAYNLWLENLLFGIGLGQAKFHLLNYLPEWAWLSSDMLMFQYNMPVFGVYPRMLAEQGLLGLVIYVFLWLDSLYKLVKKKHEVRSKDKEDFIIALFIAIIGNLLSANNWDMLSYPANWLLLALAWRIIYNKQMLMK